MGTGLTREECEQTSTTLRLLRHAFDHVPHILQCTTPVRADATVSTLFYTWILQRLVYASLWHKFPLNVRDLARDTIVDLIKAAKTLYDVDTTDALVTRLADIMDDYAQSIYTLGG
jgi:hypothetical protein